MAKIVVETTVTGRIEDPQVKFESKTVPLTAMGSNTWVFSGSVDVQDKVLNLEFTAKGIDTSKCNVKVNQLEPQKRDLFDLNGAIGPDGVEFITVAKKI